MATLPAAPTRHRNNELVSGIFTNQYVFFPLPGPGQKREGGLGKNTAQKLASKQLLILVSHKVPLLKASGWPPPALLGKLLTSITGRLTLPKLHLATFNVVVPLARLYNKV